MRTALARAGLVVAVLLVYGRVVGHEFVAYDTPAYISENPWVLRGLTLDGVRWAFAAHFAANWHPLTWISHMLDVSVLGVAPGLFALENALWHAANACLVLAVLERLTGDFGKSLFVAFLFALHPLHVESVAWIVERKDVLSTFFGLSSLLFWTRWARAGNRSAYALALVAFALGLLAKPMLVTWPCVLLLLDFWPLARGWRLAEKLPFFALSLVSAFVTFHAQSLGGAVQSLGNFSLPARLGNAVVAYATYLANTFWPTGLAFHYPFAPQGLPAGEIAAAAILLAGISAAAILLVRRAPWFLAGWLFYLGTLVPVIGIVQVGGQALADRYTYVPLLGVFLVVAWGGARLPLRVPLAVVACAALGVLAWRQVGFWKDTRTLAEHAIACVPGNHVAHDILGLDHLAAGRLDEGAAEFRKALAIAPGDIEASSNLAGALQRQEKYPEAEAVLRRALAISPRGGVLHRRLAIVLNLEGRPAEALVEVDVALASEPDDAFAHHVRGIALEALGRNEEARAAFERSLALVPEDANVRMRLARLYLREGDLAAADRETARAVASDPSNAEAHRGRARVLQLRGRDAEALAELARTLELSPEWPLALGDTAWILATAHDAALRDPKRAVELGERAAHLSGDRAPGILDALGAAYASAGRFAEAATTAEKALARAREVGDTELASKVAKRLGAYRGSTMERETPR